jgi:hypothetical protein
MEDTLDRIASALERIALFSEKLTAQVVIVDQDGNQLNDAPAAPGESGGPGDQARDDTDALKREFVKQELRRKNIAFKEGAKTSTLIRLLTEATVEAAGPVKAAPSCCESQHLALSTTHGPSGTEEVEYCTSCGKIHALKVNGAALGVPEGASYYSPTTGTESASLDQVKASLVKVSVEKGQDEALRILREKGKAEKLSQLDAGLYGTVIAECQRTVGVAHA